jgi:hypothetical protein
LELRDRLEERGWGDEEIEREISRERKGTLDRWAREEEEEKRLVLREGEEKEKSGEGGEGGEVPKERRDQRDNNRGQGHSCDYDRGRYRDHRYSDPRQRGGKGGKNAQQQQIFQEERNERLRDAFGISGKHHKEGQSHCAYDVFSI